MSPDPIDREARRHAVRDRLRPAFERALDQMADTLTDTPDEQLFGDLEFTLRHAAHDLAATAHQTELAARKKGATSAPRSIAPTAIMTPGSSPTGPGRS